MNQLNMFSAKKVKLHGMTSTKWTTKDKITQYKGLINLYTRDRKIVEVDTNVARKKQYRELKSLQKEIENNRRDLDNAIRGDKQQLRNTLAEHREMQLAYQNSQPKIVIDYVNQRNFNKRKQLDRLEYRMKLKSDKLIDLKLRHAELEDRIKYEGITKLLPAEREAHIITGKVQDALLKKEAALAIRQTYTQIVHIMKRDALYFDAILATINSDGLSQGRCMINATKLGQLATEYLDDRRQEFQELEQAVKKDMAIRKDNLSVVRQRVENAASNIKNLLRRDSDINLGKVKIEETPSFTTIRDDIFHIERTLTELKTITLVPIFAEIYPCLQEQIRQKERLGEFAIKCEENRNILLNKVEHATTMHRKLQNSMVDSTFEYKKEKTELLAEYEKQKDETKQLKNTLKSRYNLLADVRISLKQLQQLTKILNIKRIVLRAHTTGRMKVGGGKGSNEEEIIVPPEQDEDDGVKIIPDLINKFGKLVSSAQSIPDGIRDEAYKYYELMMTARSRQVEIDKIASDESLLEGIAIESHVLTREDIKKQSAEIVTMNSKNEDLIPLIAIPKKKKIKF